MMGSTEGYPTDASFSREHRATNGLFITSAVAFAHGYCVLLFKVDPHNQLQFVWGGAGLHAARSLDQLRKMVVAGQFSDDQSYW